MESIDTTSIIEEKISLDGTHRVAIGVDHTQWFSKQLNSLDIPVNIETNNFEITVNGRKHLTNVYNIGDNSMYSVLSK